MVRPSMRRVALAAAAMTAAAGMVLATAGTASAGTPSSCITQITGTNGALAGCTHTNGGSYRILLQCGVYVAGIHRIYDIGGDWISIDYAGSIAHCLNGDARVSYRLQTTQSV